MPLLLHPSERCALVNSLLTPVTNITMRVHCRSEESGPGVYYHLIYIFPVRSHRHPLPLMKTSISYLSRLRNHLRDDSNAEPELLPIGDILWNNKSPLMLPSPRLSGSFGHL